jgi:hypothetical protein
MNKIYIHSTSKLYEYLFESSTFKTFLFKIPNKIDSINYFLNEWNEPQFEDVLYYCLHSKIPVKVLNHKLIPPSYPILDSFHIKNLSDHIILLESKENWDYLKNNISSLVISYNNLTFLKMMVDQMSKFTNDIIILDNCSNFPPLLEYLRSLEDKYSVLRMNKNYGYTIYKSPKIQNLIGPIYVLSDPDIQLHPNFPYKDFVKDFYQISKEFKVYKVGCALDIFTDDIRTDIKCMHGKNIKEWEIQNWNNKIQYGKYELYHTGIDTTFCLVNTNFPTGSWNSNSMRVAGNCLAKHIPWHKDWIMMLMENEYENYMNNNNSSNWCK